MPAGPWNLGDYTIIVIDHPQRLRKSEPSNEMRPLHKGTMPSTSTTRRLATRQNLGLLVKDHPHSDSLTWEGKPGNHPVCSGKTYDFWTSSRLTGDPPEPFGWSTRIGEWGALAFCMLWPHVETLLAQRFSFKFRIEFENRAWRARSVYPKWMLHFARTWIDAFISYSILYKVTFECE